MHKDSIERNCLKIQLQDFTQTNVQTLQHNLEVK